MTAFDSRPLLGMLIRPGCGGSGLFKPVAHITQCGMVLDLLEVASFTINLSFSKACFVPVVPITIAKHAVTTTRQFPNLRAKMRQAAATLHSESVQEAFWQEVPLLRALVRSRSSALAHPITCARPAAQAECCGQHVSETLHSKHTAST